MSNDESYKRHVSEILLPRGDAYEVGSIPTITSGALVPEPPPSRREFESVATQPLFQGNVRDAVEAMIKVSLRVQDGCVKLRDAEQGTTGELTARAELFSAVNALTGVRLFLERCMGPKTHQLKTWPGPYRQVKAGLKKYEIRKADRDYAVGDVLVLQEFEPTTSSYTGDALRVRVTTMTAPGNWGLPKDVCVLGIEIET